MKNVFLLIIMFSFSLDSKACTCATLGYEEHLKFATHAFIGEAIHNLGPDSTLRQLRDEEGYGSTVKFKIKHVLKGINKDDYVIIDQRGTGNCGLAFKFGKEYLVFASERRMIPYYPEDDAIDFNDFEFLNLDSLFMDSYDMKSAHTRVTTYFKNLEKVYHFMYTDGCNIFNEKSEYFEKALNEMR